MFNKINAYFLKRSKKAIGAIGFSVVIILGSFDFLLGSEISFSLFYTIPIFFVIWYGNIWMSLSLSVIAALTWLQVDRISGQTYSHAAIPYWNAFVWMSFFIIITLLITKLREMFALTEKLADTDVLTGLANRRSFQERAQFELERCKRYNKPFTNVYIDLDNFKAINDQKGHQEGDRLLQKVAEELKSNLRKTDITARLGGDEFAVLFSDTPYKEAGVALKNMRKRLLKIMKDNKWPVTFSIGAVTMDEPLDDSRDVIKLSDDMMYQVKKNGKNKIAHLAWPT